MRGDTSDDTDLAFEGCGPVIPAREGGAPVLKQQVFECVRFSGRISRRDVAKHLDVSPASITHMVAELIDEGLVQEVETPARPGHRGRPPVALSVRAEAVYVAGINLSDASHSGIIVDFSGNPIADVSLPRTGTLGELAPLVDEAEAVFAALLRESGLERAQIAAMGLGLPGIVDNNSGTILWSPILRDRDVPIGAMLSERLGLPVDIDNDANLVTLAELWFGAGRHNPNFAVITIEHGVGMGLVVGHRLYRGAHGAALELGHTKVHLDGALCRCGQRGCLEAYVADYALVREAAVAMDLGQLNTNAPQVLLEGLYDQAKAGNEAARTIFRRAGRFLAAGLANVISLFDPSLIILSGERMKYDYLYAEEVLAETRKLAVNSGRSTPPIEINAWGDLVWARGAATLALSAVTRARTNRPAVAA